MQTAGCWGIVTDGRTPRPPSARDSLLISHPYDPKSAQPKRRSIREKIRGAKQRSHGQGQREESFAGGERVGGIHAAQNDRGRKDWPAPFHHLSRKLHVHRFRLLSTAFA